MDLSELIQSIDIVEYISQYVELEQRGDEWWGLSCFKAEKTPSFSVRRDPPVFFDYSSGIGGNTFTFTRYYFKCSKQEAIERMRKYAGCTDEVSYRQNKLDATVSCRKFRKQEAHQKESKATVLPDDYMDRYEVRPDKMKVWLDEGISKEALEFFQVRYDNFSDRIVYPIRNPAGRIVNVGGRTLDPHWKEHGQKKYCYFYPWGSMTTIYGFAENLEAIKKKHEIIIFEGCKSVLKAFSWGIRNTGCILTSHLNVAQMKLLAATGCDVTFALDNDVDIRDDHNVEKLKRYINVFYIKDSDGLLEEKDAPVDKGEEVFRKLYEARRKLR